MSGCTSDGGLLWLCLYGNSNERRQAELYSLKSSLFSHSFTEYVWVFHATDRLVLGNLWCGQGLVKAGVAFLSDKASNQGFK